MKAVKVETRRRFNPKAFLKDGLKRLSLKSLFIQNRVPCPEKKDQLNEFETKTGSKLVYDWRDYKIIQDNRSKEILPMGWIPPE